MFEPGAFHLHSAAVSFRLDVSLFSVSSVAHRILISDAGATIAEILGHVETFYNEDAKAATEALNNDGANSSASRQPVDRAFQEKVWKWLTRHPDVYVGRDKKGNKLTLEEAEASSLPRGNTKAARHVFSDSKHSQADNDNAKSMLPVLAESAFTLALEGKPTMAGSLHSSERTASSTALAEEILEDSASAALHSKKTSALRVYVGEERIWYAITGHAPDLGEIQRMDFKLLSIIAARREKGILQPELTRVSAQDKRSTPLRTQRLHEKGYIEKKKVQIKGQVTSLCTLRKFATSTAKTVSNSAGVADDVLRRDTVITQTGPQEELIDVNALLRGIFDILDEYTIVTHLDLKRKLVSFSRRIPCWQ